MTNFTLKVIENRASGYLVPDTRHWRGGTDMMQAIAFRHLFPDGKCDRMLSDILYQLAEAHGWQVEMTVREPAGEAANGPSVAAADAAECPIGRQ